MANEKFHLSQIQIKRKYFNFAKTLLKKTPLQTNVRVFLVLDFLIYCHTYVISHEKSNKQFWSLDHLWHTIFTKILWILWKKARLCDQKTQHIPWKFDYLSSNPIHTSISSIGIYQICTMKNGHKKAQKPYDIWVFGVGIQIGCITCVILTK